jgi:hypothetical protein
MPTIVSEGERVAGCSQCKSRMSYFRSDLYHDWHTEFGKAPYLKRLYIVCPICADKVTVPY